MELIEKTQPLDVEIEAEEEADAIKNSFQVRSRVRACTGRVGDLLRLG